VKEKEKRRATMSTKGDEIFKSSTMEKQPTNLDKDMLEKPSSMDRLLENARAATDKEHNMTLMQGIRLYPKAVAWSMLISTCIVMEGYDVSLVGNLYGFDAFNHKYGVEGANGEYQVPASVSLDPQASFIPMLMLRSGNQV
jgi:hypothetical protein